MKDSSLPMTPDQVVGKSWMKDGKVFRILEINKLHVVTDSNGGYRFESQEDLDYFLSSLKEAPPAGAVMMVTSNNEDIMLSLLAGLKNDFDKLENDPGYVEQAKQRSNHVNTIVNLAKLRLQMTVGK